jgi:hypothetical protein
MVTNIRFTGWLYILVVSGIFWALQTWGIPDQEGLIDIPTAWLELSHFPSRETLADDLTDSRIACATAVISLD